MADIYSIAATALADGRQRLEAIGLNAAGATTPGYRRHIAASRPFNVQDSSPIAHGSVSASHDSLAGSAMASAPAMIDARPGPLMATSRPLDLHIEGDDLYFGLTDGQRVWMTRAGSLRVAEDGLLVGERGLRVLGVNGEIRLDSTEVEVAEDGRILSDGVVVAALQLYRVPDRTALRSAGGTLMEAHEGSHAAEAGAGRLRSGALEGSNANGTQVMLDLMTVSRQYESLVRVTQQYDELLGRTIQKLGEA